jgi:hypothetical protein
MTVTHLVKKSPTSYGTWRSIFIFLRAVYPILSQRIYPGKKLLVTFCNMLVLMLRGCLPFNSEAGRPLPASCPQLLIPHIQLLCISEGQLLYSQPEDAPCSCNKWPGIWFKLSCKPNQTDILTTSSFQYSSQYNVSNTPLKEPSLWSSESLPVSLSSCLSCLF